MILASLQNKYILYLLGIGGLAFYVLTTEIWDRYSDLFTLYGEYGFVKSQLNDIGNYDLRKYELLQLKKTYTTEISKMYKSKAQNNNDFFDYTTKLSKKNSIAITSAIPLTNKSFGYFNELSYKLTLRGRFVNMGRLFSDLENGNIPILLSKVGLKKAEQSKSDLVSTVELKAYIYTDEQ